MAKVVRMVKGFKKKMVARVVVRGLVWVARVKRMVSSK